MQDIGTLGGTFSYAVGVNDSGQVVGYAWTSSGSSNAFLYSGGSMQNLGAFGGKSSDAQGINNNGQVVGNAYTSGNLDNAFLYSGGSMQDLGGGTYSVADGMNNSGQIVGVATTSNGDLKRFPLQRRFYARPRYTLPGGTCSVATAISDNGQIVGYAKQRRKHPRRLLQRRDRSRPWHTWGLRSYAYGINAETGAL